jgi:hypothetical protein
MIPLLERAEMHLIKGEDAGAIEPNKSVWFNVRIIFSPAK